MKAANRRQFSRLRIDRSVKIPIQVFPVMPFLGESLEVNLINLSPGGMALSLDSRSQSELLKKGQVVRVHMRLPGLSIEECRGVVTHSYLTSHSKYVIGIRFSRVAAMILKELQQMAEDNALCDERIRAEGRGWCMPTCSYYGLCRKPIRVEGENSSPVDLMEISLQRAE